MSLPITRRTALRSLAAAATVSVLPRATAATAPSTPTPSTPGGRLRQSVCAWCYTGLKGKDLTLEKVAVAAKEIGLDSVELLQPADFPVLRKLGLTCAMVSGPSVKTPQGVTVGGITKAWNRLEYHDTLVEAYAKRIEEVADAGYTNLICFSGNRDKLDDQQGLENCVTGLKRLLPLAEKRKVTLVMELLNSKVNHKDYMCDRSAWGIELAKRLASERFGLLYDIYHMQIMEGDVIRTIQESHRYFAHYHTAGNPGRNEFGPDDAQELNYPAIMRAIKATGYQGHIGQEFLPKRDPFASLREAFRICDV